MRFSFLASTMCILCGCVSTVPSITRLGDGLMRAPDLAAAERMCRTTGDPMRAIPSEEAKIGATGGVLFRCD